MTTDMEETATAGEILISSNTLAALPRGAAPRTKGAGHLLAWRRARADGGGWIPRVVLDGDALAPSVPVALRDFLPHSRAEPEHHVATVGFIKYEGIDALMAADGPDDHRHPT